jgi:hypothetical protein
MLRYPNLPHGLSYIDDTWNVRKKGTVSGLDALIFIKRLCLHFMLKPDPMVVPIMDFQDLGFSTATGCYHYTYDMVGMGAISGEEKLLIEVAKESFFKFQEFPSESKTERMIFGCKFYPKLMSFLEKVLTDGRYSDMHSGNIMLDEDYNYRLIDLEGFFRYPLNDPKHDWITT